MQGPPPPADAWAPPAATPPAPPHRRRRRLLAVIVAVALVVALGVGGVVYALVGRSGGHSYPSHWDARIAPIAHSVEKLRRLDFEHPVPVDFLPDAKFRKLVTADNKDLSASDRRDVQRGEGLLRALGLIGRDVDLLHETNTLQGSDVLAFYDQDAKRIRIRGEHLTVDTRVTLAHELTHALQDQHFDLTKLDKDAERDHGETALTALVEGDAERVEHAYVDTLSAADRRAYDTAQDADTSSAQQDASDVPGILVALQQTPYTLGETMVATIKALHGAAGIDDAFRDPPRTELDVHAPILGDTHRDAPHVATPAARAGERRDGEPDVFGAVGLYLTLASRLPPVDALHVADGWAGDSMVELRRGDAWCVRAAFRGRDTAATAAIADGLRRWATTMPDGMATVDATGRLVTLSSCDRGTPVPTAKDFADQALTMATVRDGLAAGLLQSGASGDLAQCVADGVVARPDLYATVQENPDDAPPGFVDAVRGIATSCRATT
jgi:hypothetical protein